MDKKIEEYLVSYLFKRFELDAEVKFDGDSRTIVLKEYKIEVPEIQRKVQLKEIEIFGINIPYCRYNDDVSIIGSDKEKKLTYDLLGEIYDHLTLAYEKNGIITSNSGLIFYPILDMKIYKFFHQIQEFIPIKYKSFDSKQFLLGVSHDIDRTGDSYRYRIITYFFQTIKQKRPLLFLKGIFGKNEETNFEYIIEKEKEFQTNSTWFILTRYGLKQNADYHIKDKEFQKALLLLQSNNKEIGVHIPFMDLELEEIKKEFAKVDSSEKMGMRMHHLRGDYENLIKTLNKAEIAYDSTFGLNECMAYRFGTSIPFHPIVNDTIMTSIYEIPLNIMDLQITDAPKYREQLQKLFAILKEVKGVCIINWHNNRFNKTKYGNIWIDTFNITLEESSKANGKLTNIAAIINYFR